MIRFAFIIRHIPRHFISLTVTGFEPVSRGHVTLRAALTIRPLSRDLRGGRMSNELILSIVLTVLNILNYSLVVLIYILNYVNLTCKVLYLLVNIYLRIQNVPLSQLIF